MPRGKKELAEQITPELREVEVEVGRGKTVAEAVKKSGVTEQTYSLGRRSSVGFGSTIRIVRRILKRKILGCRLPGECARSPAAIAGGFYCPRDWRYQRMRAFVELS